MKTDWKAVIAALIIGIAIGALSYMRCMPFGEHGFLKNPEKMHQRMMAEFTSKLKLTPDQQQKVSEILADTRAKIDALRKEMHPKFEAIRNFSQAEIRELLTQNQQRRFDELNAKMEARRLKHSKPF